MMTLTIIVDCIAMIFMLLLAIGNFANSDVDSGVIATVFCGIFIINLISIIKLIKGKPDDSWLVSCLRHKREGRKKLEELEGTAKKEN